MNTEAPPPKKILGNVIPLRETGIRIQIVMRIHIRGRNLSFRMKGLDLDDPMRVSNTWS